MTARTFSSVLAVHASDLAPVGNLLLSNDSFAGWSYVGYLTVFVGLTAGVGAAALQEHSALAPALPMVCAATLALASFWSLGDSIAQALRKPRHLGRTEQPAWSAPLEPAGAIPARLRQTRVRWRNWPLVTRAALLLVGSASGLVAISAALLSSTNGESAELTIGSYVWMAFTLVFAVVRLRGQLSHQLVRLDAGVDGVLDLADPSSGPIPWVSIVSLRFTWSKRTGFSYRATTTNGRELTWASQSRLWRDNQPGATAFPTIPLVDGDTFAAYVAARTGLTPAQDLNA